MNANHRTSLRIVRAIFLLAVLGLGSGASAFENPTIANDDRVRLAEVFRLGEKLGDSIWKGWKKAPFAVLLITPEHEFLIRHPSPTKDFTPLGYDPVLKSQIYFRPRVFSPHFLATMPAVGGVSTIVVGRAENTEAKKSTRWVVTLLHEHFHQLQDSQPNFYKDVGALGLARGDETGMWMLNFPFPYERADVGQQFNDMSRTLSDALRASSKDFNDKLSVYLAARKRFQDILAPDDYKYFSFQIWKEGVARYTEYRIAERAAATGYKPNKEFAALKDFSSFADDSSAMLARILNDLQNIQLSKRQRTAFYPFGAAEAMLLDRISPKWQKRYFADKFSLDRFFNK